MISSLYSVPSAVFTKYHKPAGLQSRYLLPHGSGGWKSEIKVLVRLVPSERWEGRISSGPLSLACRRSFSPAVSSHGLPSMHLSVRPGADTEGPKASSI